MRGMPDAGAAPIGRGPSPILYGGLMNQRGLDLVEPASKTRRSERVKGVA